ncbi:MAG: undecaprenyl-diphosphate phosphatase [Acidimicrobiales bacterium]|nr:undecaprenyl-diphosphate phosphatase [Acidimicrobiales bacterium]
MSTFQAIILGIVQGLTEFLPISSSGHLRIVPALLGWDDPGASFTAVIQLGTMAAVVIYFWKDLWRITTAWFASLRDRTRRQDPDARMGWYLIVATIPIAVIGFLLKDQIKSGARDLRLIAASLIVMGLVLLYAEKVASKRKTVDDIDSRDGIAIGLAQSMALVPGVSRSGATISAGLFLGYTREDAARFSFLLSVPAVVLSGLFSLKDVGAKAEPHMAASPGFGPTAIATVISFVVGYAAIAWLLRYLVNHTTVVFVAYRVALGVLLFVLLAAGTISAHPS